MIGPARAITTPDLGTRLILEVNGRNWYVLARTNQPDDERLLTLDGTQMTGEDIRRLVPEYRSLTYQPMPAGGRSVARGFAPGELYEIRIVDLGYGQIPMNLMIDQFRNDIADRTGLAGRARIVGRSEYGNILSITLQRPWDLVIRRLDRENDSVLDSLDGVIVSWEDIRRLVPPADVIQFIEMPPRFEASVLCTAAGAEYRITIKDRSGGQLDTQDLIDQFKHDLLEWAPGRRHPQQPHVITSGREGKWIYAPGYRWLNPNDANDLRVRWTPGVLHPDFPNIRAGQENDRWVPFPGYSFLYPNNLSDLTVVWTTGLPHPDYPNVESGSPAGNWRPAPGYKWVHPNDSNDLSVEWAPGRKHPRYPHVYSDVQEGYWRPEAGYHFTNPGRDLTVASDRVLWNIELAWLLGAGYSPKYAKLRQRFLDDFLLNGFVAQTRYRRPDGKQFIEFGDQAVYMGHALVVFSLEAKRLREVGLPAQSPEAVIGSILDAFQMMDVTADIQFNGKNTPGFFYRDAVTRDMLPADWVGDSDFIRVLDTGNDSHYAMSIDQVLHLFVGFLAVARWTDNSLNPTFASVHTYMILNYLKSRDYKVDSTPSGRTIPHERGPNYGFAIGYLSMMATRITHHDYFNDPTNQVAGRTAAEAHEIIIDSFFSPHNPGWLAMGAATVVISQFTDHPIEIKKLSSPHAMVRFALLSTETTPDYAIWAWTHVGMCPWTNLLYCVLHNKAVPTDVEDYAQVLLSEMPETGPSSDLAKNNGWSHTWGKDSSIIRSLDLAWSPASQARVASREERYNGIDYLMLEGLLVAIRGMPRTGRPCQRGDHIVWTRPGVHTC